MLADRTHRAAPPDRIAADKAGTDPGAVAAFLVDEERIAAIRRQARAEAERRAREWGFAAAVEE